VQILTKNEWDAALTEVFDWRCSHITGAAAASALHNLFFGDDN
jgi:hypothetical protein